MNNGQELTMLLQQMIISQDRTNELLEEVVEQMGAGQRQRASELGQWKEANPLLARKCRFAAEALGKVPVSYTHLTLPTIDSV